MADPNPSSAPAAEKENQRTNKRKLAPLNVSANMKRKRTSAPHRPYRTSFPLALLQRGYQGPKLERSHALIHSLLMKYERKQRMLHHQDPLKRAMGPSTVNCMRFDSLGAILATGTDKGDIFLYDFDEYVFESNREACKEVEAEAEGESESEAPAGVKKTHSYQCPLISLPTQFTDLQVVEWDPNDERYLACGGYGALNGINVYNLELQTNRPARALRSREKSGAYTCVVFGQGSRLLYSGTTHGVVKLWDLRRASSPQWEASPYSDKRGASRGGHKKTVSSLVLLNNGRYLFSATTSGRIDLWDTRNLKTPIFGTKPVPSVIRRWQSPKLVSSLSQRLALSRGEGIVSMQVNPANEQELGFQLACGWVGAFNSTLGEVTKLCPLQNDASMQTYKVKKMGQDAEAVRLSPVLSTRRNCGTFFRTESIFCASLPSERKVYIVDMSPAARKSSAETPINGVNARGFSIPTSSIPHAVATHPTHDYIIVAPETADNRVDVLGL